MPLERLDSPPRFRLANGEPKLLIEASAELAGAKSPVWLLPHTDNDVVVLHTRYVSAQDSLEVPSTEPVLLPARGDRQPRILVVGGRIRLTLSPADLIASERDYWVDGPTGVAADYADSPYATQLGLDASELEAADQVLVLGRTTDRGWHFMIVPSQHG